MIINNTDSNFRYLPDIKITIEGRLEEGEELSEVIKKLADLFQKEKLKKETTRSKETNDADSC